MKIIKIVYIPTATGSLTLPAIEIPWWNTITNQAEIASLPAKTLTIIPGLINPFIKSVTPVVTHPRPRKSSINYFHRIGLAIIIILLFLMSLLVYYLFFLRKPNNKIVPTNLLKKACIANDADSAKNALISWARIEFKDANIFSLRDITNKIKDANFLQELEQLQKKLYTNIATDWSGLKLWKCCKSFKNIQIKISNKVTELPSLHPD